MINHTLIHIKTTSSTNSYIKNLLSKKESVSEGTVVITDNQTSGRGQRGNSWEAEANKNLTFSLLLKPIFIPIKEQFILSQITSLAIKKVLDSYTSDIHIKWPNDIYWRDKKIAGILIENTLSDSGIENSIIGIGLNVNQTLFTSDAPNPISLKNILGVEFDIIELLNSIVNQIQSYYLIVKTGDAEQIAEQYKKSLYRKSGYYFYNDGLHTFQAKIKNVQPTGHLVLETIDGEIRIFAFKEVKCVL